MKPVVRTAGGESIVVRRSIRVLHVTNHLADAGGAEVSLVQMLPHLQQRGIQNALLPLFSEWTSARADELRASGVEVLPPVGGRPAAHLAGVHRVIRSFRPDVVHSTLWNANLASQLTGLVDRVPVIVGIVNTQYSAEAFARARSPWKLETYRRAEGFLARHATARFHSLTEFAATDTCRALGISRGRVDVIPRGRDRSLLGEPTPERRAQVREALGIPAGTPVVLNVARQDTQKSLHELIEAMALVADRHPDVVLLQAGRPGSGSPAIDAAVARYPKAPVRFLGQRSDVGDLLAASDLFAFSSHWEGQGGAVLEAMAMAVPVVSYDVPPILESTGGSGWSVPIGDVAVLAAAVSEALDDPGGRMRHAAAARRRFDEKFEIGAVSDRMAGMYREVVEAGRR
jgi:glycosyltransferase involved in cell wall biosynthesis